MIANLDLAGKGEITGILLQRGIGLKLHAIIDNKTVFLIGENNSAIFGLSASAFGGDANFAFINEVAFLDFASKSKIGGALL